MRHNLFFPLSLLHRQKYSTNHTGFQMTHRDLLCGRSCNRSLDLYYYIICQVSLNPERASHVWVQLLVSHWAADYLQCTRQQQWTTEDTHLTDVLRGMLCQRGPLISMSEELECLSTNTQNTWGFDLMRSDWDQIQRNWVSMCDRGA